MRFGERVVVLIFRPFYRTFVERLLWWFLARVKIFLLSDMAVQVDSIDRRLQNDPQQRVIALEERLRAMEASNAAQWDAMEQLLLALFRQPELRSSEQDPKLDVPQEMPVSNETYLNRVHAASNLR